MQRPGRTGINQSKRKKTPKALCAKKQRVARTELKYEGSQTWNKSVIFFKMHLLSVERS